MANENIDGKVKADREIKYSWRSWLLGTATAIAALVGFGALVAIMFATGPWEITSRFTSAVIIFLAALALLKLFAKSADKDELAQYGNIEE